MSSFHNLLPKSIVMKDLGSTILNILLWVGIWGLVQSLISLKYTSPNDLVWFYTIFTLVMIVIYIVTDSFTTTV